MTDTIDGRLKAMGINLPEAAAPAANYVPYVISGNLLYLSGQLPIEGGKIAVSGLVGSDVSLTDAQRAAELCAINILAQAKSALSGDLSRIVRVIKLNGFVASNSGKPLDRAALQKRAESIKQEIQQSQMSLEEQLKAAQQKALQAQP